jgi:hypothetical protein
MHAKPKFAALPPGIDPPDLTVDETAAWRRESRWTVHRKIRDGRYESFLDGRIRKVCFESVKRDRERAMAAGVTKKRPPGRPRRADDQPQVAVE